MTVLVVGGGVSGLLTAWECVSRGHAVHVIERDRIGGSIRSAALGGFTADVGAEAFSVVRPEAAALIERLGLPTVSPARSDARLVLDGVTARIPAACVLGIPSEPGAADVRAFLSDAEVAAALHRDALPMPDALPESLGDLVRLRMGTAVVTRLVDPVVRGVHSIGADDIDADIVAPGLRAAAMRTGSLASGVRSLLERRAGASGVAGSAVRSVPGGMTRVVAALAEVCGARIDEASEVVAVRRAANGWSVETTHDSYAADHVVLCVPSSSAARVVDDPELQAHLERVRLSDVVVVALRVRSAQLSAAPVGSGALVDRRDVIAKGLTHASAKWEWIRDSMPPDEHIVRLSYGRDGEDPWALLGSDPVATAVADLAAITGVDDVVLLEGVVQPWPQSLSHPTPQHAQWRRELDRLLSVRPGLHIVGPGISANGIAGAVAEVTAVMESIPSASR